MNTIRNSSIILTLILIVSGCIPEKKNIYESSFELTDKSFKNDDILYNILSRDSMGHIIDMHLVIKLDQRAQKIKTTKGLESHLHIGLRNDTTNYWGTGSSYAQATDMYLDDKNRLLYQSYNFSDQHIHDFNCLYVTSFLSGPGNPGQFIDAYYWNNTLDILKIRDTLDDPTAFFRNGIIVQPDTCNHTNYIRLFTKVTECLDKVDFLDFKIFISGKNGVKKSDSIRLKYDWRNETSAKVSDWCNIHHIGRNGYDIASMNIELETLAGFCIDSLFISLDGGKKWYSRKQPIDITDKSLLYHRIDCEK